MRLSLKKFFSYLLKIAEKYISYLIGIAASLAIFSIILIVFGYNPITSMAGLVTGSFGSVFLASETFVLMAPFLFAALAFLVAYRARFYNIGVEGQLLHRRTIRISGRFSAWWFTKYCCNSTGGNCLSSGRSTLASVTTLHESQTRSK